MGYSSRVLHYIPTTVLIVTSVRANGYGIYSLFPDLFTDAHPLSRFPAVPSNFQHLAKGNLSVNMIFNLFPVSSAGPLPMIARALSSIFLAPACQPQISFFTARVEGESRHHQLHRTTDDFPFFFLLQRQQQPTTEQLVYQMCKYMYMCIRKYAQREKQFIFLYHPRASLLLCPTRSPFCSFTSTRRER